MRTRLKVTIELDQSTECNSNELQVLVRCVEVGAGDEVVVVPRHQSSPASVTWDQSTNFYGDINGSQINSHSPAVSQEIHASVAAFELLERIRNQIASDQSLGEPRIEVTADTEQLEQELKRSQPRHQIVKSLLSTLREVLSISSFVIQLGKLLGVGE